MMKEEKEKQPLHLPFIPNIPASPIVRQSSTDPQGSYTGVPENRYEDPVQDADDL